jgi:hypothetical protein
MKRGSAFCRRPSAYGRHSSRRIYGYKCSEAQAFTHGVKSRLQTKHYQEIIQVCVRFHSQARCTVCITRLQRW